MTPSHPTQMDQQSGHSSEMQESNSVLSVGRSSSEDLPPALSETMQLALAYAKQHGGMARQPGGFWVGADEANGLRGQWFGTSTVQALVKRGVLTYDQWQESRNGKFPIRAAIALATKEKS